MSDRIDPLTWVAELIDSGYTIQEALRKVKGNSRDFLTDVNLGLVPGYYMEHWFGDNDAVGTVEEDLWGHGGTMVYLTAAETMNVISTDTTNDIAGADNARSVKIVGLDADFNQIEEIVDLAAIDTLTQNAYIRVFRMYVVDVGTYGTNNLGAITATASVAGTVQSSIEIAEGQSTTTHYTIPAGKVGMMMRVSITMETGKQVHVHMISRMDADDSTVAPFRAFRDRHHWEGLDTPEGERLLANHVFPAKTDMHFSASVTSGTATVQADYDIMIVDAALVPNALSSHTS